MARSLADPARFLSDLTHGIAKFETRRVPMFFRVAAGQTALS
jgi:hypothetical protein